MCVYIYIHSFSFFSITCVCSVIQLCLTLCDPAWTVDLQASLSMEFSRQEYWNGLPFPVNGLLHGIFPTPEIKSASLASPSLAVRFFTTVPLGKPFPL